MASNFNNPYKFTSKRIEPKSKPALPKPRPIEVGSKVRFLGGNVFLSANTTTVATIREAGLCEIIRIRKGTHKYRCRGIDGFKLDGWVDEDRVVKL